MEISSSAATGVMRVGLQVVSNHRRPILEFYTEVRNRFGPEVEFNTPVGINGGKSIKHKTRFQDIFIQFTIINIGGVRAEDIEFELSGDLKRNRKNDNLGQIIETEIPQMAPGQLIQLFRFDDHDLKIYPDEGGKPLGIKTESLQIVAKYNGPKTIINWFLSIHRRAFGKKQYESKLIFKPAMVCSDLPPAEYV